MELSGFKHIQIFGMESTGYVSGADPENWTPPPPRSAHVFLLLNH